MKYVLNQHEILRALADYIRNIVGLGGRYRVELEYQDGELAAIVTITEEPRNDG